MFGEQQEGKFGWGPESKRRVIGDEAGELAGANHQGKAEGPLPIYECLLSAHSIPGTCLGSQDLSWNQTTNIIELDILVESKRP